MKKIVLILLALMSIGSVSGQGPQRVQAIRTPIVRELPNGESLTILLRGDERKHWVMTTDGWEIEERNEFFYYVTRSRKGEKVVSRRRAHAPEQRSKCEMRWLKRKGVNRMVIAE